MGAIFHGRQGMAVVRKGHADDAVGVLPAFAVCLFAGHDKLPDLLAGCEIPHMHRVVGVPNPTHAITLLELLYHAAN